MTGLGGRHWQSDLRRSGLGDGPAEPDVARRQNHLQVVELFADENQTGNGSHLDQFAAFGEHKATHAVSVGAVVAQLPSLAQRQAHHVLGQVADGRRRRAKSVHVAGVANVRTQQLRHEPT